MMAGRGGGGCGRRPSFGGPGTAANSAGGVMEGGGGSQRDFPPVSRQQGGTSSHSASPREGINQFTSSWQQRGGRGNYNAGEGRPGHENESGSSTGRGRRSMDPIEALGRCMTGILRHQAANYNLEIRNDGYVLVSDLLKQSKKTAAGNPLSSHSEDDVRKAVEVDSKQRFELKEENGGLYIRALQGHSIKTVESERLLRPIAGPSEVQVCVHGTSEKAWNIIREDGLRPMRRNHIHFATGLPKEDGIISGMRGTSQVLIYLNVEKAIEDGIKLYISDNKGVLSEGIDGVIPPKYFKRVVKFQADGTGLELKLPHDESVANIAAEPKAEPRRTQIETLPKHLVCVYCTIEKEMTIFWQEGLKVSKVSTDKFIHFATVLPTEGSSTRGAGKQVAPPVFIHLNVDKAVEAGMKVYLQDKELVTEGTDGVISNDFFKRVYKKLPTGASSSVRSGVYPRPNHSASACSSARYFHTRQQGGTSSHSASPREGINQFTSSWQQRGGRGNYNAGEGRPGHENESGSSTGRGRRSMDPIEALGRCMTGILRHQAANYNLEIRNDGYVLVSDLLKQSKKTAAGKPLSSHSEDDVRKAVEVNSKQCLGLIAENGVLYIRAVNGHTIKTVESEHLLRPIAGPSEVPVCVHGTSEKAWNIIREDGLRPMRRNHIHFATGLPKEDGIISGMRGTSQVLIYLNVEKAIEDGIKLYISDNKVVLSEGIDGVIPPKYFKRVVEFQADGTELELKLPHDESVANIAAEPKAEPRRTQIETLPKHLVGVYCTNEKEMTIFWQEGLKVSQVSTDKFIHFATVLPTEGSSTRGAGKQVGHPVFIHLNVDKAVKAGMKVYLQDKELVTEGTDGVISNDFFKRVYKKLPTGTEINLYPPRCPKPSNHATDA